MAKSIKHRKKKVKKPSNEEIIRSWSTEEEIFKPSRPLKVKYLVNEPGVAYIAATEVKNKLGEVLELAGKKDVFITMNGKPKFKVTEIEEKENKFLNPGTNESETKEQRLKRIKKLLDKYYGSIPDMNIDPNFRKDFKIIRGDY